MNIVIIKLDPMMELVKFVIINVLPVVMITIVLLVFKTPIECPHQIVFVKMDSGMMVLLSVDHVKLIV